MRRIRYSTARFIVRAQSVHGTAFDYSKAEYQGALVKLCIVCPQHGEFMQRPHNHLRGTGCPACGPSKHAETRRRSAGTDFPAKARDVHGHQYDYSDVTYTGSTIKVRIICRVHGPFFVTPTRHLRGAGCPGCRKHQQR